MRVGPTLMLSLVQVLLAGPAAAQCDARVYRTLLGTSSGFPATAKSVDEALASATFSNRFAAFINSRFNRTPGSGMGQDAPAYVAAHVLMNKLPWRETFVGRFNLPDREYPSVEDDPNGIGYFTSPGWLKRYAGNERDGVMLVAANRILQNTIGLSRLAAANNTAPGVPNNADGRKAAACASCHFIGPYGLDLVAAVLPRKQVDRDGRVTFSAASGAPSSVLATSISSERQLIETLVNSEAFTFWSCRLAFEFVYGREEYSCEAPLFDQCADAFNATGLMQDAVRTLITAPGFCG